jgi:uncharacterized protein
MNGKISNVNSSSGTFQVKVDLSFGNCPKYIQARRLSYLPGMDHIDTIRSWTNTTPRSTHVQSGPLASAQADLIRRADTFFVASAFGDSPSDPSHGVDVSHRGGRPGFVQVSADGSSIAWPDYLGNFFFNTLGNIHKNPNCGLLFFDFDSNEIVQVVGKAHIIHQVPDPAFGAQRSIVFQVEKWRSVKQALPFTWEYLSTSPYSPVVSLAAAPAGTNPRTGLVGIPIRVQEIIYETHDTATYVLGGAGIALTPSQIPGQYASFVIDSEADGSSEEDDDELSSQSDQIRTWTISSAPAGPSDYDFTITVRRKQGGSVSNQLFDGRISRLLLTGIGGNFHLPVSSSPLPRPLVFIAGGVGVTPIMSMLRGLHKDGRAQSNTHLLFSVQTSRDILFASELSAWTKTFPKSITISIFLTKQNEVGRDDPHLRNFAVFAGERIAPSRIGMIVPDVRDCDIYMCGPKEFMESIETGLVGALGVPAAQVFSEGFDY